MASKFSPADWHTSNLLISTTADRQRKVTRDIREESNTARDVTDNITRWTQHGTDTELSYRLKAIKDWKDDLARVLHDVETEITKLTEHKQRTEKALEAKNIPLEVTLECLSIREHRVSIDLVRDEVEYELNKELKVIEDMQSLLHNKVNEAFEQLCRLQEHHRQLSADLYDKNIAIQIDAMCTELNNSADTISLHKDPTRIMKGIVNPQQWGAFSADNAARAEAAIQNSVRLREAINQTIHMTTTDLEAQWTATSYAFNKRQHEVEQAKRELEWQKENTEREIEDVKTEVENLKVALAEKVPPMMVAHTRLENRTYRPNVELCRDQPQYDMVEEIGQITETVQRLQDRLETVLIGLGTLERTLNRINEDIAVKTNSIELENQCLLVRKNLSQHPKVDELVKPQPN